MKIIIIILTIIVVVQGELDPGLRATFAYGFNAGENFFYDIARTLSAAIDQGYITTDRSVDAPMQSLKMVCYPDYKVCPLFDDIENIAGVQINIPQDEYSGVSEYNLLNMGYTNWTTTINGTCKSFYTITVYFCSEETLAKSKEERLAAREAYNETLQEGFFSVNDMKITRNESDLTASNFTMQSYLPWMGRHYYYNMYSTTECSETSLKPLFPLTHNYEVIGVGLYFIGKLNTTTGCRDWFETPTKMAVKLIVPTGSDCFYELADNPGITTIHIYFINKPWQLLW